MVVHTINRHALHKYEEFTSALETVRIALDEADPVIAAMNESHAGRHLGWNVPAKKEVLVARKKVTELLDTLRKQAKKYEKELIANGWRV
jgi:hypothetical protein